MIVITLVSVFFGSLKSSGLQEALPNLKLKPPVKKFGQLVRLKKAIIFLNISPDQLIGDGMLY